MDDIFLLKLAAHVMILIGSAVSCHHIVYKYEKQKLEKLKTVVTKPKQ